MNRQLNVLIPQRLSERTFESVQEQFPSKLLKKYDTVIFNISETVFISPYGMMLLIMLIEHLVHNLFKEVIIILPGNDCSEGTSSCMAVLSRLGFFESLPKAVLYINGSPESKKSLIGSNPEILELTKLKTIDSSLIVIDKAKKALRKTNYDETHVSDIAIMISEIVQNIFIHSECVRPSYLAIQGFPKKKKVQMAIADSGVGIPETLRRTDSYPDNMHDYQLIFQSLRLGVSQFQGKEKRGEGLKRCRLIARKHKAELFIRSGSGFYHLDYEKETLIGKETPFLIGTQIFINFPIG